MASMKDAYIAKLQAQLDEWGSDIDKLKAKADKSGADTRIQYQNQIEELRSIQATANQKLTELKEANLHTWESMKEGAEHTWNSLGNALKSAISKFQ
jgi:membrane protein involved in colicin uptake